MCRSSATAASACLAEAAVMSCQMPLNSSYGIAGGQALLMAHFDIMPTMTEVPPGLQQFY